MKFDLFHEENSINVPPLWSKLNLNPRFYPPNRIEYLTKNFDLIWLKITCFAASYRNIFIIVRAELYVRSFAIRIISDPKISC